MLLKKSTKTQSPVAKVYTKYGTEELLKIVILEYVERKMNGVEL